MKVLVLLEYGIPHYREFIFNYLNEISDDFLVLYTDEHYKEDRYEFKSVKCEVFRFGNLFGKLGIHRNVWKYIREYDVIIATFNFWRPMCWLPVFVTKKKYIFWGHAYGRWDNMISRTIKRSCATRASAVLVYTESGKEYYTKKLEIDPSKVLVTNNTLNIPNHSYTNCDRSYFLYVGRIQKRKRLSEMIEVLSAIKERQPLSGELLRIVGDGEPLDELKQLVKEKGISNHVNFVGAVYDDDELIKHFGGALAYASPGPVGLGVVHSFSYGIPVLTDKAASHGPEFDYCSEKNSFLFEDRDELIDIVQQLMADNTSSYQKGREAYRYYTKHLQADRTREIFRKAVTG